MDGTWQKIASFSNLEEGPRSSFASRIKLIQCLEFLTGCYRLVIGITSSKEPLNLMHTHTCSVQQHNKSNAYHCSFG